MKLCEIYYIMICILNKKPLKKENKLFRNDIEGLRGVAVLSVLIFHAFPQVIPGGFSGVDIFFVISGYLNGSIGLKEISSHSFSVRTFYTKRFLRLVPPLLPILIFTLICGAYLAECGDWAMIAKHVVAGAFFADNILLYTQSGYFDISSELKPLLHLWSLGVEEQFYLLFPILMLIFRRKWQFGIVSVFAMTILSFFLCIGMTPYYTEAAFFLPFSRFWEMGIGMLLAIWGGLQAKTSKYDVSVIGSVLLVAGFAYINSSMAFPGFWALVPTIGAAAIIASGGNGIINRYILDNYFIRFVGRISYSLYLWHWPIIVYSIYYFGNDITVWVRFLDVLFAFIFAFLSWKLIEKNTRFNVRPNIGNKIFGFLLAIVASAAVIVCHFDGFCRVQGNEPNLIKSLRAIRNQYDYYDYANNVRNGICHSVKKEQWNNNNCLDIRRNNIFLIGDSYAASLWPGLHTERDQFHQDFGITQITDGNDPPFIADNAKHGDSGVPVKEYNEFRLDMIQRYQPDIVLMSWYAMELNGDSDPIKTEGYLNEFIFRIHNLAPKTRIILIGSFPQWDISLHNQMVNWYNQRHSLPPLRMNFGLSVAGMQFDTLFQKTFTNQNAEYISSYNELCTKEGCLTRISDGPKDITAVDWGHLSDAGSKYLVQKIADRIFLVP